MKPANGTYNLLKTILHLTMVLATAAISLVAAAPAAASATCMSSAGSWVNQFLPATETGSFRVVYDATPSANGIDAVSGIAYGFAHEYTDLAAAVRFNLEGSIDARNGAAFTAASYIPYSAGVTYHFIFDVNLAKHTYSIYVVSGSPQITVGTNLNFRSEQAGRASLNSVSALSATGTLNICNIALSTSSGSPAVGAGCMSSAGTWTNQPLTATETGNFRVVYDATPSASSMDAVSGISYGLAHEYTDLAAAVRFNLGGSIDARSGAAFTAASYIPYTTGVIYHFIFDVNVAAHTYSIYVVSSSTQKTVGSNLNFRSEQAGRASLNSVGTLSATGALSICNLILSTSAPIPGAAQFLNASSTSVNFGNVSVSAGGSNQTITLTNVSASNVTISQVSVSGAAFTASGSAAGLILAPNQSTTLRATFDPSVTGQYTGAVSVTSNMSNSPVTIALSGIGVPATAHAVTLTWQAGSAGTAGYNVYVASTSGGPYSRLNTATVTGTSYVDSSVQSGSSYYFVVTSVNSANSESPRSTEVTAAIP